MMRIDKEAFRRIMSEKKKKVETKNERQLKYQKLNTKLISLRLVNSLDQEMIEWLDSHKPVAGYIRKLIEQDIRRDKKRQNIIDKG